MLKIMMLIFCDKKHIYKYINKKYGKYKESHPILKKEFSRILYSMELVIKYLIWDPNERITCEYSLEYIKEHSK
jgi:hypothetical protein